MKDLAHGVSAHSRLDGILYVRHIDTKPSRRLAVDGEIEIRLARIALESQILDAGDMLPSTVTISSPFCSRTSKSGP